ncbi:transcriptional regulator [Methylovirgula ligni]|uniref:Helix-turn-helix protein n=1 Tax=Methylovirgula ligni TaxID=569860 RepID=A0A3D9YQE5_9HYPH|nr:helix-turn-helix transcriptional regulator [Methylovirgula ligni]QAY94850.1 transcriptional regulator [Methylovirgula ligni]REF84725.1 helix-turn-helix protein [Methylovirgula ligni]
MDARIANENLLGTYLKDRRTRLDPAAFGLSGTRRRTPGLRREEVAQRANISPTWYTWLEQGRGGAASADVLDRIARALMLTDVEREHLFLLGLGRPPEVHYKAAEGVTPRLQRVLDALESSPAFIKTPIWDVVAWNRAAAAVLTDYATLEIEKRNILRLLFCEPYIRARQTDWDNVARFVVAAFRTDVARAGAADYVKSFVEELCRESPEFAAIWSTNNVRTYGEGTKHMRHPVAGVIEMEYSTFAVDGRPDLGMVVYNPATPADVDKVRALMESQSRQRPPPRVEAAP